MNNEEVKENKKVSKGEEAASHWEKYAMELQEKLNSAYEDIITLKIILNEFITNKKRGEK